jgi:chromosomal replication initiation ATPase DnaA
MLRGNNGHDIFFSDKDRYRMCLLLQQSAERFGYIIEAYCFMTNHIHLAIRVTETNLSKFMHYLAFRYARYVNRKYKGIVGDNEFINEVLTATGIKQIRKIELSSLIDKICEINNLSVEEFCAPGKNLRPSHARALASFLVREIEGLSLEQLGKFLVRDPSSLTKLANRLKIKSDKNPLVTKQIQEMREWILDPITPSFLIQMSGCQA